MTLGERVAAKRAEKGWSQRELSRRSGVANTQITELERGVRRTVGLEAAKKLARALGTSVDWLIGTWEEDDALVERRAAKRVG